MSVKQKIQMILDTAPNIWSERFALRLFVSPKKIRDEWYAVGYRFPWERDSCEV